MGPDDAELALLPDGSSDGEASASLDTMIFNFRASSHRNSTTDEFVAHDSGQEDEVVRPMPKLTQVPKPKPSLVQLPRSRLLEIPKPRTPPRAPATTRAPSLPHAPASTRLLRRRPPPPPVPPKAESTPLSAVFTPSPLSSPHATSTSSGLSASDALGDSSISSLVGNDIYELSRLISSAHGLTHDNPDVATRAAPRGRRSPTSDEVTAALAQKTRFRKGTFDFGSRAAAAAGKKASQERSRSPPRLQTTAKKLAVTALRLPARRPHQQHHHHDEEEETPPPPPPPLDDEGDTIGTEDSFAEEISRLRTAARTEKEVREAARRAGEQRRAAAASPEPKEISEETTANIRAASNAIDEALLLAFQPLERRRKELDKEEAADATAAASETPAELQVPSTLPLATQAIVEQLDLAFGSMTEQRHAELKAAEDAAAAAKAAEDAAKSAAEAKKQADEHAERQREMEILSFLPLRGRLMATSADVDDALLRLEQAETQAARTLDFVAGKSAPKSDAEEASLESTALADELAKLQQLTRQRMQVIERSLETPSPPQQQQQRVDWNRSAFEATATASVRESADAIAYDDGGNDSDTYAHVSFHDVLQQHVLEKLDLTILKLRHVLTIDAKEAAEAKLARARKENAQQTKKLQEDAENTRKKQELEVAAAARRRVMGLSSLEQVHAWVSDDGDRDEERLVESLSSARAFDRLATSLDIRVGEGFAMAPSSFDTHEAIARFDAIKMMACGQASEGREEQPESPRSDGSQYSQQRRPDASSDEDGAGAAPVRRRVHIGSAVVARVQQQLAQLQAERRRKQSAWRATASAR
ncbi:hypothetical protein PybrP1_010261 [[Pythium] brassicae (nom. inval.)]|nr:hypothetical protein PybrP1_010261 [[Pythium] brassicae (nom. inval.)]